VLVYSQENLELLDGELVDGQKVYPLRVKSNIAVRVDAPALKILMKIKANKIAMR
jgi:hypothetical protein